MTANIELARDESSAVISPTGASLLRFDVGDRPVVVPMDAFDGAVLAPWPNRIAGGRFDFDGTSYQLPITEPERDTALHGLVADVEWTVAERTESSVSLEYRLEPTEGYPFPFSLSLTYDLAEAGLLIRARARNTGSGPTPFGFGFHPWFSPGLPRSADGESVRGEAQVSESTSAQVSEVAVDSGPALTLVDEAQLVVPAANWFATDERLIPTEIRPFDDDTVVPADHVADDSACIVCKDFRALRTIGGTILDDAFGSPRRGEDGWSRARLKGVDDREIVIGMGRGFRTWQVCTGDGLAEDLARTAIAIEPMMCPPNAFATGESGADFDVVAPGQELTVEWSISLTPEDEPSGAVHDAADSAAAASSADD